MHTLSKHTYLFAACLSALAGFIDAAGFMHLGGYFISFMSGNTTRLALAIAGHELSAVTALAKIIFCFVFGAMAGVWVRHFAPQGRAVFYLLCFLTLMLVCAAIASGAGLHGFAVAFMLVAMGAENAIFLRGGETVVGLTYMTGTLVKMGQKLAQATLGGAPFSWLPYALLWLGLLAGGVAGALGFGAYGLGCLWVAAGWAALLALAILPFRRHIEG